MGALPGGVRKPHLAFGGRTVLEHSLAPFDATPDVEQLVVVVHADDLERTRALLEPGGWRARLAVVPGGAQRFDSVCCGVEAVSPECEVVAVHDGARPLVRAEHVRSTLQVAHREGAALLSVPVRDTLKRSPDGRLERETVPRDGLWAAQTPQAFRAAPFRECLERAREEGYSPTDDAALWERYVGPVTLVEGEASNLKITTPADLALAEMLFQSRSAP